MLILPHKSAGQCVTHPYARCGRILIVLIQFHREIFYLEGMVSKTARHGERCGHLRISIQYYVLSIEMAIYSMIYPQGIQSGLDLEF